MSDPSLDTLRMEQCVARWQAGDRRAADELLRAVGLRLEHLARKMLRGFPTVHRWADTADVLQGAMMRLLQSLQQLRPASTRDFFNLAAVQVRRELLDLARRFATRARAEATPPPGLPPAVESAPDGAPSAGELEQWCRFHEAIEELPAEEREVVGLAFYQGWTQAEIAALLGVDVRTVRRWWQAASVKLSRALGGELPQL